MYEIYTRQSLPEKQYRELLGTALCVFNSNIAFVIENILRIDNASSWYQLMDKKSGELKKHVANTICKNGNQDIADAFADLIERRNRIIHSFQITDVDGLQKLATKTKINKGNRQFIIDEKYLMDFIRKNEILSSLLHSFRGN